MGLRYSMPHSRGLSSNPYPESNQLISSYWYLFSLRSILILSSHLSLGLPKGLFPVGVPVKTLKAFLHSSILATWPAHLNFIGLITLSILGERYELWCFYRIHKGSPVISILSRIHSIHPIDTYFFKFHSNIVLPSTPRPS
jgi:hypothetical protein